MVIIEDKAGILIAIRLSPQAAHAEDESDMNCLISKLSQYIRPSAQPACGRLWDP